MCTLFCCVYRQVAERVERRLRMIQSEMDADRAVSGRYEELSNLSMELRNVHQTKHLQELVLNIFEEIKLLLKGCEKQFLSEN